MDRGRYKIFLGMAAGVGKTYRMLQEGQAEAAAGRDVVIGYLEPHEREETSDQARGLELVPRRRVPVRDVAVEEMDLPALLARGPELALIDELAHTNPPGLAHGKRYEDIADVLAAGIDVFSTVNVQHLESLNDQVAELTGVRVRETVPDSVLGRGRRGRPHRPHPGGADRAPAGRQDLPGREHRRRPRQLLPDREPGGAARGQPAPGGRGRRVQAPGPRPGRAARHPRRRAGRRRRPAGGRRAAAGPGPAAAQLPAPGPPRLALGPAARHRPRPALGEAAGQADRGRAGAPGDGAAPARLGARRDPADRGARRPRRRGRAGRPRARLHLHHGRRGRRRPAASPACASRCRSG